MEKRQRVKIDGKARAKIKYNVSLSPSQKSRLVILHNRDRERAKKMLRKREKAADEYISFTFKSRFMKTTADRKMSTEKKENYCRTFSSRQPHEVMSWWAKEGLCDKP